LAGETATEEVNSPSCKVAVGVGSKEGSDVSTSSDVGPMSLQNSRCKVIDLHLELAGHPGAFEPKIESADAAE